MATCLQDISLETEDLEHIIDVAKDFALTHGIVYKPNTGHDGDSVAHSAPFALFPSVVPRNILLQAKEAMKDFNTLMYQVAQDHNFLEQSLKSVIRVDPFVSSLWSIHCQVREERISQPISLDLFRNDFMMNVMDTSSKTSFGIPPSNKLQLRQIEFNTIAASFAGLISRTTQLHRYTLDLAGKPYSSGEVPDNDPALGMAEGIVSAWKLYGNPKARILFLTSSVESNILDQRWLEFNIHKINRDVRVMRATLLDVHRKGNLDKDKTFFLEKFEVAVVYMRSGYGEESYTSEREWQARLLMERSRAIKCPTVRSQLSGCKKIQQELARPGAVEQFIKDPAAVQRIRNTFAGLFSLDLGSEGDEAVKMAIASPQSYVMKPQREGGGHNLYGANLKEKLESVGGTAEREAYILMERIYPLPEKNYLIKSGVPPVLADTVSEMGIYGVHIGDGEKEVMNTQCGHMLRTKAQGMDEGGIVVGISVLDSPFVVDV